MEYECKGQMFNNQYEIKPIQTTEMGPGPEDLLLCQALTLAGSWKVL